jgi:glycosyltransferase involved in cell wall biosynthesis
VGLHIGVDAWNLAEDRRGIGRYVRMILSRWARWKPERVRTTLIIPEQFTWIEKGRYLKTLDFGPLPVRHRGSVARCKYDAIWFPWNGLSWTTAGIKIATVHDGFFFAWPPTDPAVAAREQLPVRAAARDAAQIITDSHFSKSELIKFLGLPPDRIDVVHLGVDDVLLNEKHVPATFEGASRYVLFVGELESRKGIDTLLEAAALLPDDIRNDTVVAIAGRLSERPDLHGRPVPPPPPGVRIELLGHVSDERLRSLYAGAAAFVFPSRYEGFGLPVLEAMACGAPVIASDAASIPEAGGDAAAYFPVGNAAELSAMMLRLFTDAAFAGRLREAGLRRAASMSWDVTADQTLDVFERVVERDRRQKVVPS